MVCGPDGKSEIPASACASAPARGRSDSVWIAAVLVLGALAVLLAIRSSGRSAARREHLFWKLCQVESPATERTIALRELIATGNSEWRSAQLYGLNLADGFLPGVALADADLSGGNFTRVVFVGANLARSRFHQSELTAADLSKANLAGAEFYRARLADAKFSQAVLVGVGFQVAEAPRASFQGADLSRAKFLMADLAGANFSGANLSGADFDGAVLKGANLFLARLEGAKLDEADFTDTNWWQARGLSREQLAFLRKRFPPTESSPQSLRDKFRAWSEGRDPAFTPVQNGR